MRKLSPLAVLPLAFACIQPASAEIRVAVGSADAQDTRRVIDYVRSHYDVQLRHHLHRLSVASFRLKNERQLERLRQDPALAAISDYVSRVGIATVPEGEVPYQIEAPGQAIGGDDFSPNDPDYSKQWPIPCLQADKGWDIIRGGDVIIAIIDTGVDHTHEDIAPNYNSALDWDFVNDDDDAMDDYGHGTHVAGTASAVIDNGIGIAGAFQATIMGVKVLNAQGSGYMDDVAAGIDHAVANGAAAINMSLGGPTAGETLTRACSAAYESNVLVVAAAGNSSVPIKNYPASLTSVIGVGALGGFFLGHCEKLAYFSSRGFGDDTIEGNVEVVAPGKFVYAPWPGNSYSRLDGTSMASPHVAALCAAYRAYLPHWTSEQIRHHIQANADPLGNEFGFGYGRADFYPPLD